jgi:hypothetical protein
MFEGIGRTALKDDALYHIVTGQYCGQMLASITSLTHGLISIVPKDKNGNQIDDGGTYDSRIIHQADGSELKEWYAFAAYLSSFADINGDSVADLPDAYRTPKYNKIVFSSLNPVELFKNPNKFTFIAAAVVLIVLLLVIVLLVKLFKRILGRDERRYGRKRKYR